MKNMVDIILCLSPGRWAGKSKFSFEMSHTQRQNTKSFITVNRLETDAWVRLPTFVQCYTHTQSMRGIPWRGSLQPWCCVVLTKRVFQSELQLLSAWMDSRSLWINWRPGKDTVRGDKLWQTVGRETCCQPKTFNPPPATYSGVWTSCPSLFISWAPLHLCMLILFPVGFILLFMSSSLSPFMDNKHRKVVGTRRTFGISCIAKACKMHLE